jgi:hypothetical protein
VSAINFDYIQFPSMCHFESGKTRCGHVPLFSDNMCVLDYYEANTEISDVLLVNLLTRIIVKILKQKKAEKTM